MIEPNFICLLYRTNCNLLFGIGQQKNGPSLVQPTNRIIHGFMARIFSFFFSFLTSLLR